MKKELILIAFLVLSSNFLSAACTLNVSLLNQDPYPAVPGDYVKVVLQIEGVSQKDCGDISIYPNIAYPFSLDADSEYVQSTKSGTFVKDYSNHWIVAYKLRVDKNALDGVNNLSISYSAGEGTFTKEIPIQVENPVTTFEVHVKTYSPSTKQLTLEVLNVGEKNVDSLVLEMPKQDSAITYGANYALIGTLDSNDDDTVTFNADMKNGEIKLILNYNDENNFRRTYETTTPFDEELFSRKLKTSSTSFSISSFIYGILFIIVIKFIYRFYKKRKMNAKKPLKHYA